MQTRIWQDCFILPGPPNFFISLQVLHSPQSSRWQFSHWPHRVRRRLIPGPTLVPIIGPLAAYFLAVFFCRKFKNEVVCFRFRHIEWRQIFNWGITTIDGNTTTSYLIYLHKARENAWNSNALGCYKRRASFWPVHKLSTFLSVYTAAVTAFKVTWTVCRLFYYLLESYHTVKKGVLARVKIQ